MLFPLVLGALCLGCGSILARTAGAAIPAPLLLPCGLAAIVVVTGLATAFSPTAQLALPAVVGLAAAGLALLPRRLPGPDVWIAAAAALVTVLLYGWPVLAAGDPTFAGYVKLDDTATFLAFADHVLDHGRDLSHLPPSTYEATLAVNVANGYPLGSILPLAVGSRLIGVDPAWVWQPYISFGAGLLTFSLFALARPLLGSRWWSAAVAVVGSQSALLLGYALWGGVKEVVAASLLALGAATAGSPAIRTSRAQLVPATCLAAFIGVMSLAGLVWLLPLVAVAVIAAYRSGHLRSATALVVLTAALALPAAQDAGSFLRRDNISSFRSADELGNLVGTLPVKQVLGIWPAADFRTEAEHPWATAVLLVLAGAGLLLGLYAIGRRRHARAAGLLASAAIGCAVFVVAGSPWVGGKSLAIASPVALFVAALGFAGLRSRFRLPAAALLGLLAVGVGWSTALAHEGTWLAPYGQLRELEAIGNRFAGRGPALMTEYQPYGVRHFLRKVDAEGASELRRRRAPLATGLLLEKAQYADIDEFELGELTSTYPLLVLRRSPVASRPPGAYALALRGEWYDVWERTGSSVPHLSLGATFERSAVPGCVALTAFSEGRPVRAPESAIVVVQQLDGVPLPLGWSVAAPGSGSVVAPRDGTLTVTLDVPRTGNYDLWVAGSTRGRLSVVVDDTHLNTIGPHLDRAGMWSLAGSRSYEAGRHTVRLVLTATPARSGSPFGFPPLGPIALAEPAGDAVLTLSADPKSGVCLRPADWFERPSG
ncbi:MAG: hypothetical protein ACKVUT_04410 [Gaiella sp.]